MDQPVTTGDDQLEDKGLDQSETSDSDRPVKLESENRELSYVTDKGSQEEYSDREEPDPQPSGNDWKKVKRRRGGQSGQSDASEVEDGLFANTESDGNRSNSRYFHQWFDDKENEQDYSTENETGNKSESDETQKVKGTAGKRHGNNSCSPINIKVRVSNQHLPIKCSS